MSLRRKPARLLILTASTALVASVLWAQFERIPDYGQGRGSRGGYSQRRDYRDNVIYGETENGWDILGAKNDWEIDERFEHEAFRFARVRYSSGGNEFSYGRRGQRWGGGWRTDFPESDLNFPHRLRELTSMEVHPESVVVQLTDDNLSDYPFLYLVEPGRGRMNLSDAEVEGLRRYLLNGGFLMVDDFWDIEEWNIFYENIKRVFPDREPEELPLEHEIFHLVYDLAEKPVIVSINTWRRGLSTESYYDKEPHYRAIFDDKRRIMVMICYNTDLGDGWEEEGVDPRYFKEYSERFAYPLGINIVTYAMTH